MHDLSTLRDVFDAPFLRHLGVRPVRFEKGVCEAAVSVSPQHWQQDGFVHAGVQATLADHCAGIAALSLVSTDQRVLTAEFKINLLRPARGSELTCIARVLKPGRRLTFVESDVYVHRDGQQHLSAKALVTIAMVA